MEMFFVKANYPPLVNYHWSTHKVNNPGMKTQTTFYSVAVFSWFTLLANVKSLMFLLIYLEYFMKET